MGRVPRLSGGDEEPRGRLLISRRDGDRLRHGRDKQRGVGLVQIDDRNGRECRVHEFAITKFEECFGELKAGFGRVEFLSRTSICQPSCDDLYCERLKGDAASQANRPCAAPRWSSSDTRWVVATMGPSSSHPATDHVAPVRGRYLRPLAVDQLVETGDEALHNLARDGPVRCRHARRRARAAHRGPFPRALGSAGAARIAGRPDDIDCQPRSTVLATPTSGHPGTGVISRGHVDQGRLLHPAGVSGPRQHLDGAARSPVFVVR